MGRCHDNRFQLEVVMHTTIPDEWFDPKAPLGRGKRYRHPDCCEGKDRALVITRTEKGWLWKCHRCQDTGFKPAKGLPPGQWLEWKKASLEEKRTQKVQDLQLPPDFTTEIPAEGLAWLFKADLSEAEIKEHGFGWSPVLKRVIMPVYMDGQLVYWQGRNVGEVTPERPKYMNVFQRGRDKIYFEIRGDTEGSVVLVEDILSAIKVGRFNDAIALLYAYVPDDLIWELSEIYNHVLLWLDPDKWDRMLKRVSRYRSFGINVTTARVGKDPKNFDDDRIEEILTEQGVL